MATIDVLLRQQLSTLLKSGNAHMSFDEAVADFPEAKIDQRPRNVEYTFWQLLEHLRLSQRDMLDYLTDPHYTAPHWPEDYWPASNAAGGKSGWDASVLAFQQDRDTLVAIAVDPDIDLTNTVPTSNDHTILRCLLIIADHNAYHIGELGILRQVEHAWPDEQSANEQSAVSD